MEYVTYPDLPGCISEGKSLANALYMAQSALKQWLEYLNDKKMGIPAASAFENVDAGDGEFVNFIRVEAKGGRAVKRTVSIPQWMDEEAIRSGISLSRVLQEALTERFAG